VGSDSWYLPDITGDPARRIDDEESMDHHQLRDAMEADGPAWSAFLGQGRDPEEFVTEVDEDDGYERDAPIGLRLAGAPPRHGSPEPDLYGPHLAGSGASVDRCLDVRGR
jgi:hypothetical protein